MRKQGENRLEVINRSNRRVQIPGDKHGPASWRHCSPAVLVDTLETVSLAGGALRLGFTKDGGAFALGIYGDSDPYTLYCSPNQSIDDFLRSIRDGFDIIGNSVPPGTK